MTVLHSHPGSFLLLVKNLLQYQEHSEMAPKWLSQDVKVDWKLSWADLKVKLRKLFASSQEAFDHFSLGCLAGNRSRNQPQEAT